MIVYLNVINNVKFDADMLPSVAQDHLNEWTSNIQKVFYYHNNVYAPDVIIILKVDKDVYTCDKYQSSIEIDDMNEEQMLKLLTKEVLVYIENFNKYVNYSELRTQGCQCGGWMSVDDNCHSFWCKRYKC